MTTKLMVTPENMQMVAEFLKQHGYDAQFQTFGDGRNYIYDTIRDTKRYARIRFSNKDGFYLSTTSTETNTMEDIELFAREAVEAKILFRQLQKLLGVTL